MLERKKLAIGMPIIYNIERKMKTEQPHHIMRLLHLHRLSHHK